MNIRAIALGGFLAASTLALATDGYIAPSATPIFPIDAFDGQPFREEVKRPVEHLDDEEVALTVIAAFLEIV